MVKKGGKRGQIWECCTRVRKIDHDQPNEMIYGVRTNL